MSLVLSRRPVHVPERAVDPRRHDEPRPVAPTRFPPAAVLTVAVWAYTVVPMALQALLGTRRQNRPGEATEYVAAAIVSRELSTALLALAVAVVVVGALPRRQVRVTAPLAGLVALWALTVLSKVRAGGGVAPTDLLLPALLVAVASVPAWRPGLRAFSGLYLGTLTVSLAMVVVLPQQAFTADVSGATVVADKGLIDPRLLAGVFDSGNNLGLFAALGAPIAAHHLGRRAPLLWVLSSAVVLWTGSRTAIAAMLVAMAAAAFVARRVRRGRREESGRRASTALLLGAGLTSALLPFMADGTRAFTERGQIWAYSLKAWAEDPWLGNGAQWFGVVAGFRNDFGERLGSAVFHGHNQTVQLLVTVGIVGSALAVVLALAALRRVRHAPRAVLPCVTAYGVALAALCALEVPIGLLDRQQFWFVVAPLAILLAMPVRPPAGET